jgi:hypothetical protein
MYVLLACSGCNRNTGGGYVAKVGNAALTRADLDRVKAARSDSIVNREAFINEWVIDELLFQEADRRGFTELDEVRHRVDEARKRIAVAALLENVIYQDTLVVADSVMLQYFNNHSQWFQLHEDLALVSFAAFSDRDAANAFRSRVVSGRSWEDELERLGADTVRHGMLMLSATRQYFNRFQLNPPELWKLASSLPKGDVSFALQIGALSYVLRLHSLQKAGSVPDFDAARSEIGNRLLMEQRRERYERFVGDLRSKANVDIRSQNPGAPAQE